jgi:hypothetical protein
MIDAKVVGMLFAAFVAGSFVASPELRAYAANTVRSIDIVDGEVKTVDLGSNAVTAGKIKDGEVKAAEIATDGVGAAEIATNAVGADEIASNVVGFEEIATDAVGASELQGVTELDFFSCPLSPSQQSFLILPGNFMIVNCPTPGLDSDDTIIATFETENYCIQLVSYDRSIINGVFNIQSIMMNTCDASTSAGLGKIGFMVFDKVVDSKT